MSKRRIILASCAAGLVLLYPWTQWLNRDRSVYHPDARTWTADVGHYRHWWNGHNLETPMRRAIRNLARHQSEGVALHLHFPTGNWVCDKAPSPAGMTAGCDLPFALIERKNYKLPWEVAGILKTKQQERKHEK
jgi:hypothetical protein